MTSGINARNYGQGWTLICFSNVILSRYIWIFGCIFFKGLIIGWLAISFLFLCEEKTAHLSGVGKLQHCTGLILARVLEDDDGVLARGGLQDVAEVGRHRGEDHLVRVQRAPVRARQSHVDKILNK